MGLCLNMASEIVNLLAGGILNVDIGIFHHHATILNKLDELKSNNFQLRNCFRVHRV